MTKKASVHLLVNFQGDLGRAQGRYWRSHCHCSRWAFTLIGSGALAGLAWPCSAPLYDHKAVSHCALWVLCLLSQTTEEGKVAESFLPPRVNSLKTSAIESSIYYSVRALEGSHRKWHAQSRRNRTCFSSALLRRRENMPQTVGECKSFDKIHYTDRQNKCRIMSVTVKSSRRAVNKKKGRKGSGRVEDNTEWCRQQKYSQHSITAWREKMKDG